MKVHEKRTTGIIGLYVAVICAALLPGCASFQGAPEWDNGRSLAATDSLYATYLNRYYVATINERIEVRNQFIEIRAALIDRSYAGFKQTLYSQRVGSAVGVDVATLALSAIGAAVSDVGTKTAASALSGGLIGSKASVDKNVYFDRTLPAMLAQMDGRRSEIRRRLLSGMLAPASLYPLMQAAADLDEYFHAGTIPGAISAMTNQAGVSQNVADARLASRLPTELQITAELNEKGVEVHKAVATTTTEKVGKCMNSKTKSIPPDLTTALEKWLADEGQDIRDPLRIPQFLKAGQDEPLRAKALADPVLKPLFDKCN
ncbi:MAG: hypothetical protein V4864_24995 [Pseudomonadota bacterium]